LSKKDVEEKYDEIMKNAKKYNPKAKIDGIALQKMVSAKSHEVIIGSKKDSLFGSVVLFGMGGIAVEAFKDRNVGIPPLNQTLAKRLIEGTKIYKLLKDGFRNIPAANMELLEKTLVNFSKLLIDLPEIKEIDMNPIAIDDKECIALDARMILDEDYFKQKNPHLHDHLVISPYPKEFVKKIKFEGTDLILTPIKPEDEPMWLDMFQDFSEETKRYRFFHLIKDMPHNKRVRYTFNDYSREIAIVPVIKEDGKEKILGVVRMTGDADHEVAEFAIVLRDKWQSKGLGEILFDHIMDIARKKDWKKMIAGVLPDNSKMLNLFKKKGCTVTFNRDENMYEVVYNIKKKK
jgi:acetyltransferase